MFYSAVSNLPVYEVTFWLKCESVMVLFLMVVGIMMGAIGVFEVLAN